MKKTNVYCVMAAFFLLVNQDASATDKVQTATEKCYGIVKMGMNDCATATRSCASSSTKDSQRDAFIFVPAGTCSKIVGGFLTEK